MNNYAHISILSFNSIKASLPAFVKSEWKGREFKGFNAGVVIETEKYKYDLRYACVELLDAENWTKDLVGKGNIAERVLQCFQHKDNNLLGDKKGVGESSLSYFKLLDAVNTNQNVEVIEQILFDLFALGQANELTFERLIGFFGKKYSVLAFLFFLQNDKKYLPISTSNFEHAFKVLGVHYKLQKRCDWGNYVGYINIIREIKIAIETEFEESINLLDAHSYCWMLGYRNRYQKWLDGKLTDDEDKATIYDSSEIQPKSKSKVSQKSLIIPDLKQEDSTIDWDKQNRKNRLKGAAAEEHVLKYETLRLKSLGKEDLASKVEDYSKKIGQGFDVLSFNEDGSHRKIEVKATGGNSFMITANELEKSQQDNYWIYLVTELQGKVKIRKINAPLLNNKESFTLIPQNYQVNFMLD